jgi:hypothetical protein
LVLHDASCLSCAEKINREIETPAMKFMWLDARTHLGLPTSSPPTHLKVGTWDDNGQTWPNMDEVNFEFKRVPVGDHPFRVMQPQFLEPGIFFNRQMTENFEVVGLEAHIGGGQPPDPGPERKSAYFQPFSPELICRMVAKIAHGAAVAELGLDAFNPFLPDLIMGRSKFLSHYIGSPRQRGRKRDALHTISLELSRGFLIANVGLFSILGLRPFQAVVGTLVGELANWCRSSSRSHSTAPQ